jgi:hypothetical protein
MSEYTLSMKLLPSRAKILLTQGSDELLRASLPPPATFWTGKPAKALLEGLAIWLNARLRVVLDATDRADGFCQDLTDEAGTGHRTVFYEVVPIEHRRRPARLRGVDDFRDVRQLSFLDRLSGGGR